LLYSDQMLAIVKLVEMSKWNVEHMIQYILTITQDICFFYKLFDFCNLIRKI